VRDMLDFAPAFYRKTYAEGYLKIVRMAPELWGYLYTQTDRRALKPAQRRFRAVLNKLQARPFHRFLAETKPDAALCTHFLPIEFIANMAPRHRRGMKLFGVVTDFAAHALWFSSGVDCYYVASEAARRSLQRRGQPKDRLVVTGIPVMPAFARREDRAVARARLGLPPSQPVVLLLNGGYGVGPTLDLLRAFISDPPPCRLLFVAGRNRKAKMAARALADGAPIPITVFGYANNVHELMDAADFVMGKPGGLTAAEALAKGKPLLITDPIPGQEQRNADYLLEAGCGVRLTELADAPSVVRSILADPIRYAALAENALRHGRPRASEDILDDVIRRCRT
jgi:processive 1,2-diacylglycerol beta-glucosyltransferase